jgi:hypothetical protein
MVKMRDVGRRNKYLREILFNKRRMIELIESKKD